MQNGQEKEKPVWLWTVGAIVCWQICQISLKTVGAGPINVLLSVLCVMILCWRIAVGTERRNRGLSKGFDSYGESVESFSNDKIAKVLVAEALNARRHNGQWPVVPGVRKKRIIITAVYLVLNALLMNWLCTKNTAILVGSVLTVAYAFLFFGINTISELAAAMKRAPDTPVTQLVTEKTVAADEPNGKAPWIIAGALVFALSVSGVVGLNWNERWVVKPVDAHNSYLLSYKPGVNSDDTATVPRSVEGNILVGIGAKAFKNCNQIRVVEIPDTVLTIGKEAFAGCKNLQQVNLGKNLHTIDSFAFRDCGKLAEITLPQSLEVLNGESFKNCVSLKSIVIPEKVVEIRGNTFEGCTNLGEVTLHEDIIDIHGYAFKDCKSLKAIELPPKITEIHAYTFENCSALKSVEIPIGVTRIAAHAFYGCSCLEYVFVPDTVAEIGSSAFRLCTSLEEIRLPASVAVDERAFKESPTRILEKELSDDLVREINEECAAKESAEIMYIAYVPDRPDEFFYYDENTILAADSPRLKDLLGEELDIFPVDHYQMLQYLKKAKDAGVEQIVYGVYSEIGTQATGRPYLMATTLTVDEGIAQMEDSLAEANHE